MGDQRAEIRELRRRLDKLEEAYDKHKKQRASLIAFLRLAFTKLKLVYRTMTEGEEEDLDLDMH